jgi:acetylornithine deacetylase/succinyl-diaminopimelate desuccinylase-like protein
VTTNAVRTPSSALEASVWAAAHDDVVATLQDLIRIPSVNPPDPARPDEETRVARYLGERLRALGLRPEIVEPAPGRGSVHARLRGDGTGGEPFLLMSHLDVVPAPPERWTHDPFAADIADGYVYGRGAVDMKGMVALELGVISRLVAEARTAGRDPVSDPIPGLRRDVLFTCVADEEAGSTDGARWFAAKRPEWLRAAAAVNECGGVSVTVAGRRLYPIQVAEKGFVPYRIHVSGTWGHGSMPREDNAAVLAAAIVERLAVPGPIRMTPVMSRFLEAVAEALPTDAAAVLRRIAGAELDAAATDRALDGLCETRSARTSSVPASNTT